MTSTLPIVGRDLPEASECYGHVRRVNGIPEPDPFTSCPQCDGRHDHRWTECLVVDKRGENPAHARRCWLCGGRQCDAECVERRHHAGPHLSPAGEFRPVGR